MMWIVENRDSQSFVNQEKPEKQQIFFIPGLHKPS